ncbi:MAG: translation initiation factor IF-2 [Gammaproteobacteria bacterium]|nr:translation initiation factor IF-2 [Gammaproteobacteria bacterium]
MADISVRRLAENLNSKVGELISQLKKAGLDKAEDSSLTENESKIFLDFLTKKEGKADINAKPKTLSLKSKRSSEELVTDSAGRKRTVKVVRRKERVVQKTSLIDKSHHEPEDNIQSLEANNSDNNNITCTEQNIDNTVSVSHDKTTDHSAVPEATNQNKTDASATEVEGKAKKKLKKRGGVETKSVEEESGRSKPTHKAKRGSTTTQVQNGHWDSKKVALDVFSNRDLDEADPVVIKEPIYSRNTKKVEKKPHFIKNTKPEHAFSMPSAPLVYEVEVPTQITVSDLAQRMALKSGKLIKTLMQMGHMATINQLLEQDIAVLLVEELGHKPKLVNDNAVEENLLAEFSEKFKNAEELPRAPVVTIMGHVDHGKTSLLDYIRRTKVTDKEAGGITQHIGAYSVNTGHGKITFLDTPGHAAFSAMRARGANVTDVVILVVSADDGVMPQTVEAIQHAKAAGVPIVVAINKIDKKDADPDRVKNELVQHSIIPEDWGGENQFVEVSAKTGVGIDGLLDAVLLQTEILELKAPVNVPFKGIVIEARLDKGRGVVATILVQKGTMRKGDIILAGAEYGRIRVMLDAAMHKVEVAGPSDPVEILGLSAAPRAGDEVVALSTERQAREIAMFRQSKVRGERQAKQSETNIEDVFSKAKDSDIAVLNVIIKADVQGSTEAILGALEKLSTSEVRVKIIGSGVGGINESDVTLAMASKAIIIGFNVRADQNAKRLSEAERVKIIYDSIIYNVIDDVKNILSGMLQPEIREEIIGLAEVRDVFRSSKLGAIAGCMVVDGFIKRHSPIRVLRDNIVVYEGELESLRRFKDDVNEVKNGIECGIGVKNYNDIKPGDQIEVFKRIEISRKIE